MSKIKIIRLYDDSDCETCGGSYAEGFEVFIDEEPFGDYMPRAHCFGSDSYSFEILLEDLLKHFGHEIETETMV